MRRRRINEVKSGTVHAFSRSCGTCCRGGGSEEGSEKRPLRSLSCTVKGWKEETAETLEGCPNPDPLGVSQRVFLLPMIVSGCLASSWGLWGFGEIFLVGSQYLSQFWECLFAAVFPVGQEPPSTLTATTKLVLWLVLVSPTSE